MAIRTGPPGADPNPIAAPTSGPAGTIAKPTLHVMLRILAGQILPHAPEAGVSLP